MNQEADASASFVASYRFGLQVARREQGLS
jgi:hypothetical protein